jgi:DNA polymerase elongation subunit (family B)
MHILDDEGIKVDKFKYTGVEVVRTSMPNAVKPYAKKIIETMLLTQSHHLTNNLLKETYEVFKTLPIEDIAFVMGVKGYEKYATKCREFSIAKGTPVHVKAAYLHNFINKKLGVDKKYEEISSGDKIRFYYTLQPNKYGIDVVGFKYNRPDEYDDLFKIDYEKMFEKILYNSIERFYDNVKWQIRKPTDNVQTELFELFS